MNTEVGDRKLKIVQSAQLLQNGTINERVNAANRLGEIGHADAITPLIRALTEDENAVVRQSAAFALGEIAHTDATLPLMKALSGDESADVRRNATEALGKIEHVDAIPPLGKVLTEDESADVRQHAAEALGEIGHADAITPLGKALTEDESAVVRRRAALALGKIGHADAITQLDKALTEDESADVRWAVAQALGIGHAGPIPPLGKALIGDKAVDVRWRAAVALGELEHPDAIPLLGRALTEDKAVDVRSRAADALGEIGHADAILPLDKALTEDKAANVRWRAAEALGKIEHADAVLPLGRALTEDESARARQYAAEALGKIGHADAIPPLGKALTEDENAKVRQHAAEALGKIEHADAVLPLGKVLVEDKAPELREVVAHLIHVNKATGWREKANLIIQILQGGEQQRADINASATLQAIIPPKEELGENQHLLTDYLISLALGKDSRMTAIIAKLIIESAGESPLLAGERINKYQEERQKSEGEFRKLRIEIGGETALDPIMTVLKDDLHEYFRIPIAKLNCDTQEMWQKTIQHAQYGFLARMVMSVAVFLVGVGLLIASSVQFMSGQLQPEQLWGPSVSFASGLGTMLLIIYTGPLKEIRQSVNDLGIASAAFIAYVHRVLEISHTFSFYYLRQNISFDEMKKSSDLIEGAMDATIRKLHLEDAKSVEEIIKETLDAIKPPTNSAA